MYVVYGDEWRNAWSRVPSPSCRDRNNQYRRCVQLVSLIFLVFQELATLAWSKGRVFRRLTNCRSWAGPKAGSSVNEEKTRGFASVCMLCMVMNDGTRGVAFSSPSCRDRNNQYLRGVQLVSLIFLVFQELATLAWSKGRHHFFFFFFFSNYDILIRDRTE